MLLVQAEIISEPVQFHVALFFLQRRAIDVQHFCGLGLVIVDLLQGEQDGSFFSPVVHLF